MYAVWVKIICLPREKYRCEVSHMKNFSKELARVMIACENRGHSSFDDFPEVRKIEEEGATSKPKG